MEITTESFLHFLHVLAAIVGLMMGAVMHAGLFQMRRADRVELLRPWVPVTARLEPLLPAVALVLLGSGIWLVHLSGGEFSWTQGWIVSSIAALVIAEGIAGALLGPRAVALRAKIRATPDGPIPPDLHRIRIDPALWYGSHFVTAVFFGVVFLMVLKPSATWSAIVLLIAAAIGLASTVPFLRPPSVERSATGQSASPRRTEAAAQPAGDERGR